MKPEEKQLIKTATRSLSLDDIILLASRFERPSLSPQDPEEELLRQYKRSIGYSVETDEEDSGNGGVLNVTVALGTRLRRQTREEEPPSEDENVVILIEAEFLAAYKMTRTTPDDALEAFARLNAVHNVWPFWRQHVFDVCQRAKLPDLKVPLIEPAR